MDSEIGQIGRRVFGVRSIGSHFGFFTRAYPGIGAIKQVDLMEKGGLSGKRDQSSQFS
jgi:hypothetical protein